MQYLDSQRGLGYRWPMTAGGSRHIEFGGDTPRVTLLAPRRYECFAGLERVCVRGSPVGHGGPAECARMMLRIPTGSSRLRASAWLGREIPVAAAWEAARAWVGSLA